MNIEQLVTFLNEQRELAAPAPWQVLELYSDGVTVVDVNGFEHVEIPNVAIVPDWEKLGNGYLAAAAPQLLAYVNVLNRNLETTENALRRMLKMHALMMAKTNHAASFYDAECLHEMAEAPYEAAAVLEHICGADAENTHLKEATCVGCGCTDGHACLGKNSKPCSWLKVNRETGMGVCSCCPTFLKHPLTTDGEGSEVRHG